MPPFEAFAPAAAHGPRGLARHRWRLGRAPDGIAAPAAARHGRLSVCERCGMLPVVIACAVHLAERRRGW